MKKKLGTIMLLDDNLATNYIHKKFIKEAECAENVIDFRSGTNALSHLQSKDEPIPDVIFIDINMPIMNAWEFLESFKRIMDKQLDDVVIILLSTSLSPRDQLQASQTTLINEIRIKPLTVTSIQEIMKTYFPEYI